MLFRSIYMWGSNDGVQIPNFNVNQGDIVDKPLVVQKTGYVPVADVSQVVIGKSTQRKPQVLALSNDGSTVYVWGNRANGKLGNNVNTDDATPTATINSFFPAPGSGLTVMGLAAGGTHSAGITSDGQVWAWGLNTSGQVGDFTIDQRIVPAKTGEDYITLDRYYDKITSGSAIQLKATYHKSLNVLVDEEEHEYEWKSMDENILTVAEDGTVTKVAPGTTKVIVKAKDDPEKSAMASITAERITGRSPRRWRVRTSV